MAINDQATRVQYISAAAQTVFVYPFEIFAADATENDLKVFQTPAGQTPDPGTDILTLDVDYTVTGVGAPSGGTIVLIVPANLNDIITIERDIPIERTTDFTVGGEFTGTAINSELDRLTAMIQQVETKLEQRGVIYLVTDQLSTTGGDNTLPVLTPQTATTLSVWTKNSSGNLQAVTINSADDVNTLRSELANDGSGTDGARIVGYFSDGLGPTTVRDFLDRLEDNTLANQGAALIGYNDGINPSNVKDTLDGLDASQLHPIGAVLSGPNYIGTPLAGPTLTAYDVNAIYVVRIDAVNPASSTLNIDGIAPLPLKDPQGNALEAGALESLNNYYFFQVNSGITEFQLLNQAIATATNLGQVRKPTSAEILANTSSGFSNLDKYPTLNQLTTKYNLTLHAWASTTLGGTAQDLYGFSMQPVVLGPGRYKYTLSVAFANTDYIVNVTPGGLGGTLARTAAVKINSATEFEVELYNSAGVGTNDNHMVTVVGRKP